MSEHFPFFYSRLCVIPQRTDCKAVVSVLPGEVMGPDGFQLSVTLSEVHLPRMWVEKHPSNDSQVCLSYDYHSLWIKLIWSKFEPSLSLFLFLFLSLSSRPAC